MLFHNQSAGRETASQDTISVDNCMEPAVPRTFHCSIVTPTETIFDDEVVYASIPAYDGQHGVIWGQSPLLTRLGYGSLGGGPPEGGGPGVFPPIARHISTLLVRTGAYPRGVGERVC